MGRLPGHAAVPDSAVYKFTIDSMLKPQNIKRLVNFRVRQPIELFSL